MNAAFAVVFALFVAAMVGLAVTALRWGIRRDRAAWAAPAPPLATGPDPSGAGAGGAGGGEAQGGGDRRAASP